MKITFSFIFSLLVFISYSQSTREKLAKAFQQFDADSQMRNGISSLYVINAKTGEVVFDKNSQIGLAPASTQKIITAATAFELLGKDFTYQTKFLIEGKANGANLIIKPSGDPTLGSWRWKFTSEDSIIKKLKTEVAIHHLKFSQVLVDTINFEPVSIPSGWIWQDLGNYYGAPVNDFNWRENQFDVLLKSGSKIGDPVEIAGTVPQLHSFRLTSRVRSAAAGSGDNAYIYFSLTNAEGIITGTIPVNEKSFKISGAIQEPRTEFTFRLSEELKLGKALSKNFAAKNLFVHYSPSLDSIIYWFLQKSINLYGEALVKTFAYQKTGLGSTDTGVNIVKNFWKDKGIDIAELNIKDGSGLSPQNRVTTHAQVEVLKYAKQQSWFSAFYAALPTYNNMKMKSGTIADVRGFCGYHKSSDGNEYIFSFLVNNYNGSGITTKMYKVLDALK